MAVPALNEETRSRMRDICWEIGTTFPRPLQTDCITLASVHPRCAFVQWNLSTGSIEKLSAGLGDRWNHAQPLVRVYDVTSIIFDGNNAHSWFDLRANAISGSHYFNVNQLERTLLAQAGFRLTDGTYCSLARSNPLFLDRDRHSSRRETTALFVGAGYSSVFPVDNLYDSPVFDEYQQQVLRSRNRRPVVASVKVRLDGPDDPGDGLDAWLELLSAQCGKFGARIEQLTSGKEDRAAAAGKTLFQKATLLSNSLLERLLAAHARAPLDIVHCHDWYSSIVGIEAKKHLGLPMVLSLHSVESERAGGTMTSDVSRSIFQREKRALSAADIVIVPCGPTRDRVPGEYGIDTGKITIIPDHLAPQRAGAAIDTIACRHLTVYLSFFCGERK